MSHRYPILQTKGLSEVEVFRPTLHQVQPGVALHRGVEP